MQLGRHVEEHAPGIADSLGRGQRRIRKLGAQAIVQALETLLAGQIELLRHQLASFSAHHLQDGAAVRME